MLPEVCAPAPRDDLAGEIHAAVLATDPERGTDLAHVLAEVRRAHPLLPNADAIALARAVTARVAGLGPLEPLLADEAVTDVMVDGHGMVWVERLGELRREAITLTAPDVDLLVERIVGPLGLRADRTSPIADARLPDGSRVNVIVPPLAVDGPCVTIRRFGARRVPLGALCPPGVAELLAWAVHARSNVVVSGGTGAGKTTVLNALGALLPDGERIVTVEDTAELRLPASHVVRLEARPATADGLGATTIRQLVRNALRMRPDRIIVGEVRGAEAVDMLWAMNTGHEGSLSTCHANSPLDALRRLEMMVLSAGLDVPMAAVRDQLSSSLDLVVQVARTGGGARSIVSIAEVVDPVEPDGPRVRMLAGPGGLHDLPLRPPRAPGAAPPDPGWCP
ncbi:MAG: CpaF family protein [Acidimicrobiales bacterium]